MTEDQFHTEITKGRKSFDDRQYESAYQHLSLAIRAMEEESGADFWLEENQKAELYALRGSALYNLDRNQALSDETIFRQVLHDLDMAIDLAPLQPSYLAVRGEFYRDARFADFSTEAKTDFEKALELGPENIQVLELLTDHLIGKKLYAEALEPATRLLRLQPTPEHHLQRGICLMSKPGPELAGAASEFLEARRELPQLEAAYVYRAQCLEAIGSIEEAIEEYDLLIEAAPGILRYYLDRGALHLQNEDRDLAMEDFEAALAIDPNDPQALNNRAYVYRLQGDHGQALHDAQAALKADPEAWIAHATMAEIYADLGEPTPFFHHLEVAAKNYYTDVLDILSNPAFADYRGRPEFQEIVEGMK